MEKQKLYIIGMVIGVVMMIISVGGQCIVRYSGWG